MGQSAEAQHCSACPISCVLAALDGLQEISARCLTSELHRCNLMCSRELEWAALLGRKQLRPRKETMAPRFVALADELRDALVDFDPEFWSGQESAVLVEVFASTEKVCAAAKVRAAARVVACGLHTEKGFTDPEDWLARVSGSSTHQAREDLKTAERLEDCPATKAAVLDGDLSMGEACEITKTEAECPGSEDELLDTAKNQGLGRLKEKARKKRQAAADPDELRRKQERARDFCGFVDDMGMVQVR